MSTETTDQRRADAIAGLRAFADFLESTPAVPVLTDQRMLLALHTNEAVAEFAAAHGLDVVTDEDGNTSCDLTFGVITYHAYGYADFKAFCEQANERRARQWAGRKGMVIQPAEPQPPTCAECVRQVKPGQTYCDQVCRNLDDRHDADDYRADADSEVDA
jgi:hypothetical protein